jgi:transcriptional regulator with XRE-family HTH domain
MNTEQMIKTAIAYKGISQSALARAVGMTPSNFNQKLKRDSFTTEELESMAKVMGGEYQTFFVFPGGFKIGDTV